ncbi:MAG: TIGR02281 family clan AA aspartic protease [Pseudomonadota bacterium]
MNGYIPFAAMAVLAGIGFVKLADLPSNHPAQNQQRVAVEPQRSGEAVAYRKNGHFMFNAAMNGRNVRVLVDTGASGVAINESTARRIGLQLKDSDFTGQASTANGKTAFARANIKRIEIGGVTARNVAAMVLRDEALGGTLLGMSFLNKLSRFEFDGNRLTLVQ